MAMSQDSDLDSSIVASTIEPECAPRRDCRVPANFQLLPAITASQFAFNDQVFLRSCGMAADFQQGDR